MPPRRGTVRQNGSTPRAEGALSYFQHQLMSDSRTQALPNLPTRQSFAYGSAETPLLPRQLVLNPHMDLVEMAGQIEKGIEDAKDREQKESASTADRSRRRRSSSANVSPIRRTRREPTPDQTQLLESLRDATRSPSPIDGYHPNDQSTATPTPPIPHTISTTSSPALDPAPESRYPHVPADKLYPSPLLRSGVPAHDEPPLSSSSGLDNESVISYSIERDIHDDDLRRTLSDGKNITAPPRRVSGMAFVKDVSTIHEEEEPDSRLSQYKSSPLKSPPVKPLHPLKSMVAQKAPSPERSPSPSKSASPPKSPSLDRSSSPWRSLSLSKSPSPEKSPSPLRHSSPQSAPSKAPSLRRSPLPQKAPTPKKSSLPPKVPTPAKSPSLSPVFEEGALETTPEPEWEPQPEFLREDSPVTQLSAPTKSDIPHFHADGASAREQPALIRPSLFNEWPDIGHSTREKLSAVGRIIALLALAIMVLTSSNYLGGMIPFGQPRYYGPLNGTGLDAISSLSAQMSKLGSQVSTLSRDIKTVKADIRAQPTKGVSTGTLLGTYIPKTNFLAVPLGIIVDPHKTSPTVTQQIGFRRKVYSYFLEENFRRPQPPLSVATAWEDIGDCWCSVLRDGMTQVGVLLGYRIVPEEVVVEHVPKAAALNPGLAPRDMELWVRFRRVKNDTLVYPEQSWGEYLKAQAKLTPRPNNPAGQDDLFNDERFVLHEPVMHALKLAYPGESEEAYWGQYDERLGPAFYRVGRWTYDINSDQHAQRFILDAVIDDPEIRVDKVVIRAKNNWGADNTCIYRVKLFGKK
ncbi:uncharacterized protein BO95DRAFT_161440 [Aspergillus brunneoviolaceus CBS 621.78]|uniref:Uncharacterized protein n=1 Tax=Aspergillus brunneoviolaceus CBS 621.78 TaxID=1450534 RepID=A0ACD1G6M7_9EURO|nr:hypothetical protein BO95DRAFT_161440 [Aspergillus brunneoviolaceus CBS 621.78]RAH44888.1 hypothetical protein BO95DRAFT_161440 [Aspergillus brunneoviolaceus CBS 621.78]